MIIINAKNISIKPGLNFGSITKPTLSAHGIISSISIDATMKNAPPSLLGTDFSIA
jgi:hypothetical protein